MGQCGHEGCGCIAGEGGYCSDYCREDVEHGNLVAGGIQCECSHAGCREPSLPVVPR
jgi:hypothetical protein